METTDGALHVNRATDARDAQRKEKLRRRAALAQRRQTVGWTQQNLAEALDVSTTTVSRWECGRSTPALSVRDALASALKISVYEVNALINDRPLHASGAQLSEVRRGIHRTVRGRTRSPPVLKSRCRRENARA